MTKICKVALSSLLICCTASSVFAFDVDGIRTGITTSELVAIGQRRGLEVKETVFGNWTMGKFSEYRIDGVFTFCGGGLISFNRSIDFDVDYVPFLNQTSGKYGAPQVRTTALEVSGAPGQSVPRVEMVWYTGNDRITLSFSPEMRDGKGTLRFNRHASVDYLTKSSCRPAASW
jgi:hypothetical protein